MPTSLQARKQELMRDAMWEAAIDLFAQQGFDETTVDDIARAAGVSRRSFFRYFSSKNDLMAHGIVSYDTILIDAIKACPKTYSPSEILREVVVSVCAHSAANPRTRKIMEIAAKYPAAREAQVAKMSDVQDHVAEAFGRCVGTDKDAMTAHVLAGLTLSVIGVTFRFWFAKRPQDIAVTADRVLASVNRLICEGGKHRGTSAARKHADKRSRV